MPKFKRDYRDRYAPDGDKVVTLSGLRSRSALEVDNAVASFEFATRHFQKTVTEMRDAAAEVSKAATRLTAARAVALRIRRRR